jgi:hypothetical protein
VLAGTEAVGGWGWPSAFEKKSILQVFSTRSEAACRARASPASRRRDPRLAWMPVNDDLATRDCFRVGRERRASFEDRRLA